MRGYWPKPTQPNISNFSFSRPIFHPGPEPAPGRADPVSAAQVFQGPRLHHRRRRRQRRGISADQVGGAQRPGVARRETENG
jgi:hypothetical protein